MKRITCISVIIIATTLLLSCTDNITKQTNPNNGIIKIGEISDEHEFAAFDANLKTNEILLHRFISVSNQNRWFISIYNYKTGEINDICDEEKEYFIFKYLSNGSLAAFTTGKNLQDTSLKFLNDKKDTVKEINVAELIVNSSEMKKYESFIKKHYLSIASFQNSIDGRYFSFTVWVNNNDYDVVIDTCKNKVTAVFKKALYFYFLDNTKILHARILPKPSDAEKPNPIVGPAYRGEGAPRFDYIYEVYDLATGKSLDLPVEEKISSYLQLRPSPNNKYFCIIKDNYRYIFRTKNIEKPLLAIKQDKLYLKNYNIHTILNDRYYIKAELLSYNNQKKLYIKDINNDNIVKSIDGEYSYFKILPDNKIICVGSLQNEYSKSTRFNSVYLIDINSIFKTCN